MNDRPENTGAIGTDPLDPSVGQVPSSSRARKSWWLRNRLALGLSPTPAPALLLLAGLAVGPGGLNLLSRNVLAYLDPAVSAALAALGVLIGLGLDVRRSHEIRLLSAATIEAALTIVLVGAGVVAVSWVQPVPDVSVWLLALILAICASASSTAPGPDSTTADAVGTRIGDLDDVLPIVLGGVVLATLREPSPGAAAWLVVQCIGLAIAAACAAWLLVSQSGDSEQRVFTVGIVLLLGGIAEFLSLSALLVGLVAGVLWSGIGGSAGERIARDVRHMQHPLVVLLLLVAGAGVSVPAGTGALILVYVALRLIGKIAGGWIVRRMVPAELPSDLGLSLIWPGVIAVAFALNAEHAGGDTTGHILGVVVAGSIFSELIALVVRPKGAS